MVDLPDDGLPTKPMSGSRGMVFFYRDMVIICVQEDLELFGRNTRQALADPLPEKGPRSSPYSFTLNPYGA